MPEVIIDRFLVRVVPRMIEWEQGHDWIVDGDSRLEIAWLRNGSDWTVWSAAENGDKRDECDGDVIIHCPGKGKQINQTLMSEMSQQLEDRCSQLA